MKRCDQRNRLGLPFGTLHDELLEGASTTTYDAVHDFIETPTKALKRQATDVKRLHRREGGRQAALKLAACHHTKACGLSSGCFACASIFRRWALPQAIAFAQRGIEATVVVLLIKEVPIGELHRVNLHHECDALRKRLKRAGIASCMGNMEVSFKPTRLMWSVHVHLLVFGACSLACDHLEEQTDLLRAVHAAPVVASRCVRQISYIIKFVTYYHHPSSPRPLPLPEDQLVELVCWRMKYTLLDHMVLVGFQRRGVIVPGATFERMLAARDRFWRRGDVRSHPPS